MFMTHTFLNVNLSCMASTASFTEYFSVNLYHSLFLVLFLSHSLLVPILIVDLMMALHMACTDTTSCAAFGEFDPDILLQTILCQKFTHIAVVGDQYRALSIKNGDHSHVGRGIQMAEIHNPGRNTPLPKQRQKMLSNPANKANIANFLMVDWAKVCSDRLTDERELYLSGGFSDGKKVVLVEEGMNILIVQYQIFSVTTKKQIPGCLCM